LLVDRSTRTGSGAGAPICPAGSALRSDRAEVRAKVVCNLMKRAAFCRRRPVDRWVLTGGIDRFPIAMPDHADSSDFVVRISLRANPDDRVVINGVPIGGRAGLSIGFVVACCLTTA
jgi:hypothetical protein